jgi:hypothetical protein
MGIHRKAARSLVFGMAKFGGLGLDLLATLQGHIRLQYLLGHLQCGDHTGQLVIMLIEYTQLECGSMDNILEQNYDKFSKCIINKNWTTEIWQHLHRCKATVAVQQKWKLRSGRMLIPQARPAHKYPSPPWEMIHPPGGDNAVCM